MKFEEKLMKLRKKNAWSQEEFAEKLNVTRQTISKWELGQTVPDTDNLSKIATIFGISVNDLLDESINPIAENSGNKNNNTLKIVILVIILILALLGIGAITLSNLFNKMKDTVESKPNNEISQENPISGIFDQIFEKVDNFKQENFNSTFKTLYYGEVNGSSMKDFLDEIIKSNEENKDRIITLKYKDIETSNAQEIRSIKDKMSNTKKYEVSYEYDEDGYINKAIVLREKIQESAVNLFNSTFKALYFGSTNGFFMNNFIDEVIASNEEHPDNIITVNYNGKSTSNADELRKMKKKFNTRTTYEISYEYDENGLINKANISK